MIKYFYILSLLSLSLLAQKVIIYSECNYPPYSYCVDNQVKGISVDIYKSIFSKIKDYEIEVRGIDINTAYEKMEKSEIFMLGNISSRPIEKPYIINYSTSFLYQKESLYCNKDFNLTNPKLKIANITHNALPHALKEYVEENNISILSGTARENFSNLINKKIDCHIIDDISMEGEVLHLSKKYTEQNKSIEHISSIQQVLSMPKKFYYIGFSKKIFPARKDLIENINLALRVMNNSYEIRNIIDKNLKTYLNPIKKRVIKISLYNWGEKLVSSKLDGYGIIPSIVKSAFNERNIEVDYQFFDFKYAYLLTKWGKECASVPWIKNEERELYFDFSDYIHNTGIYLFYKKEKYPEGIEKTLKQYNIGGVNGYYYDRKLKENRLLKYTSYNNIEDAIKALLDEKIDIIPADKHRFKEHLRQYFFNERNKITFKKEPRSKYKSYIIFSKNCENFKDLKNEFNIGFRAIKENGTFDKIIHKFDANEIFSIQEPKEIKPYRILITYNEENISITGYTKSIKDKKILLNKLKSIYPKLNIKNELNIAKGEPTSWVNFITDMIDVLKLLGEGSIEIINKEANLAGKINTREGMILFDKALDKLSNKYKSIGYTIAPSKIIIVKVEKKEVNNPCSNKFNAILKANKIIFESSTDILSSKDNALFLHLYKITEECPKIKIHIIGHTDSSGNDEMNHKLSLKRAETILRELEKLGISRDKLKAIGKGETLPISDNSSKEGQARNRRIEFKIIGY